MKYTILFSLVALLLISCNNTAETKSQTKETIKKEDKMTTIHLTKAEFLSKVANFETNPTEWKYLGDKPALIDFYADWCGPCKMMSPILQEVKLNLKDAVKIIKVNVDQHQDLASHFMVRGVPTLMLFKTGKMLWRQSGVLSARDLTTIISNHLN